MSFMTFLKMLAQTEGKRMRIKNKLIKMEAILDPNIIYKTKILEMIVLLLKEEKKVI